MRSLPAETPYEAHLRFLERLDEHSITHGLASILPGTITNLVIRWWTPASRVAGRSAGTVHASPPGRSRWRRFAEVASESPRPVEPTF
jgi:hypothetical protein